MAAVTSAAESIPRRAEQRATRLAFFIAGFGVAAWAPLVPFVKQRAGLDDGVLGLLLLCLGGGSIIAMPLAGALVTRFGCRRMLVIAVVVICLTLPLLASLSSLVPLGLALFVFGAGIGVVDCVINIQAVIVERASGRPMMSGFHGLFSVGGILGAAGVSAMLTLGVTPLPASIVVVAGVAVALLFALPGLLQHGGEAGGPAFAIPRGAVLFLGVLCFVVFLTEGAALDWSAVFLTQMRGVEPSRAGFAYAAFALTMTIGRLTGDAIVQHVGRVNIVVFGGLCAAAGLIFATLVPSPAAALFGYALVGAGCANMVPVFYTAASRQTAMPESIAIPAITTIGYAGILIGPAAIGFVAQAANLSVAFLILAAMLLGVAACGRFLRV